MLEDACMNFLQMSAVKFALDGTSLQSDKRRSGFGSLESIQFFLICKAGQIPQNPAWVIEMRVDTLRIAGHQSSAHRSRVFVDEPAHFIERNLSVGISL